MAGERPEVVGIDFGTTNTVLSTLDSDGRARILAITVEGEEVVAFRSTLSFHADPIEPDRRIIEAGPFAIAAYLEDPLETRFIQSFKTYAASPLFQETRILGRRYPFEDLLSTFLLQLRAHAELSPRGRLAVVGRPVRFAGQQPDETLAMARYGRAFARLGFSEVRYAFEPVAAAVAFAERLEGDAIVLVGDFGGGTSDFSVVRFVHGSGGGRAEPLASAGVPLAGDAFDYRIIDRLVSPELGKGSSYRAFDNILPVPNRYFAAFARWEQLALLRASRDMREIRSLARSALEPEKIGRLIEILDDNLGYRLYQAVTRFKEELSHQTQADFAFDAGNVHIERRVERTEFEAWIAPELAAMEAGVETALERAALAPEAVDRVFLTGGSSFVPAVRAMFERRFGAAKVEGGAELVSIAAGLARLGASPDLDAWSLETAASA
ncbi:MAG TPA: Hsp70 family protein [Caulobacteraceae bacterium]|nr:Hsp70 family protein [Caulobacteraceae bacterium]